MIRAGAPYISVASGNRSVLEKMPTTITAGSQPVRIWLRAEGLAVLAASVLAYHQFEGSWLRFALLFLLPDVSMLTFLGGPRMGAIGYNLAHTYVGPIALAAVGAVGAYPILITLALIWSAHIGFDRLLGYGLKHPKGFHYTHLGVIGRRGAAETES